MSEYSKSAHEDCKSIDRRILGEGRGGEHPLWKVLRLWPIVVAALVGFATVYAWGGDISGIKESVKKLWVKVGDNRDDISELKTQTQVIQFRLKSIDEKIGEQKADIKEILREIKK